VVSRVDIAGYPGDQPQLKRGALTKSYMLIGLGWFGFLWLRAADALAAIEHDMEEA
jgi:hypothetical protein